MTAFLQAGEQTSPSPYEDKLESALTVLTPLSSESQ